MDMRIFLMLMGVTVWSTAGCPNSYRCNNRECTQFITDRCNGSNDCKDGSEKINCGSITTGPPSNNSGTIRAYIVSGVIFGSFIVDIIITILICLFGCKNKKQVSRSARSGSSSRRSHNMSTNIVQEPTENTTTPTTTSNNAFMSPACPIDSNLQQESPPSYSNTGSHLQLQTGAYTLQAVREYPQQESFEAVYPLQQQPLNVTPHGMCSGNPELPCPPQKQAAAQ